MFSGHARLLTKFLNPTRRSQLREPVVPRSLINALINDRGTRAASTTTAVHHPSYDIDRYRHKSLKSNMFVPFLLLVASSIVPPSASMVVKVPRSSSPPPTTTAKKTRSSKAPFGCYFEHKTVIIPHDDKKHRGGEDAASTSPRWLVVADGVGSWADYGINPGDFSRALTESVVELGTEDDQKSPKKGKDLVDIVHQANMLAQAKHKRGSATLTTVKLTGPKEITTLNIGDSGYSLHRRENGEMKVLYASEPGQHGYNWPHQLGGDGDDAEKVGVKKKHTDVEPGDVIVVYSDGVSDNINPTEFHSCLEHAMEDHGEDDTDSSTSTPTTNILSLSLAADFIAKKAYFLGKDKEYNSPFAQKSSRYKGGKHDDITVVVAQVRAGDVSQFVDADPYFKESITLYTGDIGPVEDLPKLKDLMKPETEKSNKRAKNKREVQNKSEQLLAADPIATMTVVQLKEILKSRELKVSGNKKELQDRLRSHEIADESSSEGST